MRLNDHTKRQIVTDTKERNASQVYDLLQCFLNHSHDRHVYSHNHLPIFLNDH